MKNDGLAAREYRKSVEHIILKLSNIGYLLSYDQYCSIQYLEKVFIEGLLDEHKLFGNYDTYIGLFLTNIQPQVQDLYNIFDASRILGVSERDNKFDKLWSIVVLKGCESLYWVMPFRNKLRGRDVSK